MVQGFNAFAQAFEQIFLVAAGFAELFQDFAEGLILFGVALELFLDGLERLALDAVALGNGVEQLGQGGEIARSTRPAAGPGRPCYCGFRSSAP